MEKLRSAQTWRFAFLNGWEARLKFGYSNNFNMIFGMPSKRVNPKYAD